MIRFVTAMRSEALPLVAHYGMTPQAGSFPWYVSDTTALVVSGVGKRAAAAATAFLHAKTGETPNAVWMNVGIAGHGRRDLGEVLVAHTIRDAATEERWYPPRGAITLPGVEVISVDRPEVEFGDDAVYEMEAAGFYPTALRFATSELVQVLKVTSDNRERSFLELTAASVSTLVEGAIEDVKDLAARLQRLRAELPSRMEEDAFEAFTSRWRFTTSERRALTRLLVRWRSLEPTSLRSADSLASARTASEALVLLTRRLHALALEHPV